MSETLETALAVAQQPKDTKTVLDVIASMKPEIEKSLQSEAAADILVRHYYNAIRYNQLLRECTAESLVAALLLSAQVRLEPGPLGHVYLVPYKDNKAGVSNVVWMLGYTGIVELARRGGAHGLRSTVVYDCDEFVAPWENEKGLHWELRPGAIEARDERVGALVTWKDGTERQALFMPPERVAVAVRASKNPKASELAEADWYWRKCGVRFARPWLPLTTDAAAFSTAIGADGGAVRSIDVTPDGEALAIVDADDE